MKKYLVLYLVIISLLSCMTNNGTFIEEKNLEEIVFKEINENIKNMDLFRAYQLLTHYEMSFNENAKYENSRNLLYSLLPDKLENEYENSNFKDFFVTYRNLEKLNFSLETYDFNEILYSYIINNIDKNFKSAVLLAEAKLDYTKLKDEELLKLQDFFHNIVPVKDYVRLTNELNNRDLAIIENINGDNYLDGLFTVYVNKGILFENGIGSSDIVVGSGFFIDKNGHGITNYHVIEAMVDPEYEGTNHLYVKLNNSVEKVPAKVIGWDKVMDLALIKVSAIPDYVYSFSQDFENSVGKSVVALGSPGGLSSTVTRGIISAVDRPLLQYGAVIQIDTPINPGNSGGPLIDDKKDVTNVVFAGIEEFEGVNFAIPIKYLKGSLEEMYSGGEAEHVWLGAGITYRKKRLEVIYIKPQSPAYMLGLDKGDIIKSINSIEFNSVTEIQDYLLNFQPEEIVEIEYESMGKVFNKKICLERRPSTPNDSIISGDTSEHLYIPLFGMDIKFTGRILWNKQYLVNDVFPGTIADDLEIRKGDKIIVRNWEYNEEFKVVILQMSILTQTEGFFEKTIQLVAPINVNFFI